MLPRARHCCLLLASVIVAPSAEPRESCASDDASCGAHSHGLLQKQAPERLPEVPLTEEDMIIERAEKAGNPPISLSQTLWFKPPAGPTPQCKQLGSVTNAMQKAINMVFLPSGFRGDMASFNRHVQTIYPLFEEHASLSSSIAALNYFIAEDEIVQHDDGRYCTLGCHNIARLLCCEWARFAKLANRVCGSGSVVNTIIVHNDPGYGGAGAVNGASLTTNALALQIAVHEVGHSLFRLADEYTYSTIDAAESPNCDTAGCSKWQDLIGHFGASCLPGYCTGGRYYAAYTDTLMNVHGGTHFGAVSERVACCKYMSVDQVVPNFCWKFNTGGLDLTSYCKSGVWESGRRRWWPFSAALLTVDPSNNTADMIRRAADTQGTIYRYIAKPVAFDVHKEAASQDWTCVEEGDPLEPGLYQQSEVEGDEAVDAHLYGEVDDSDELVVVATHADGSTTSLPFHKYDTIEVPADPGNNEARGGIVRIPRTYFRVVFDSSSPVETCAVRGT